MHEGHPTFSVVIATDGRAAALAELLETLPFLSGPPFEVCVVRGPSADGAGDVLATWHGRIKTWLNPVRNLSSSRNIGVAMAAGDIVAFVDDDAIPQGDWLAKLAAAFADPAVACAGGVNLDRSGHNVQYGYATCDRLARTSFTRTEPADGLCAIGAPEFPYVQGPNAAVRRADIEAIGGFDEEYDFYLDETDVCCRLVDAGRLIRQLPDAFVHHRALPSQIRNAAGTTHSLYSVLKNKLYFSLINNRGHHDESLALVDFVSFSGMLADSLRPTAARDPNGMQWLRRFAADVDQARRTGLARGRSGRRRLMSDGLIATCRRPFLPLVRVAADSRPTCTLFTAAARSGSAPARRAA
jgi:GT2 family glycosyltransferase